MLEQFILSKGAALYANGQIWASQLRGQGSGSICKAPCNFTRAVTLQAPVRQIPQQIPPGASFTFETLNLHSSKFQSELSETPSPVIRRPDGISRGICLTGAYSVTYTHCPFWVVHFQLWLLLLKLKMSIKAE